MKSRSYSIPPIPDCSRDIEALRYTGQSSPCSGLLSSLLLLCSKEELQKFLAEEDGAILVQKYVSQLDAV